MAQPRGAPAAVVFDMDGLLLDSERLALEAFVAACRSCGFEPDLNAYLPCIGTPPATTRVLLLEGYGPGFPYDEIAAEWSRIYREIALDRPVPLKPGARAALEIVAASGRPVGIATSTAQAIARRKLAMVDLLPLVDVLVGGDEVSPGKPDPAPYLEAARRLRRLPARCWAVEDSDNGVRSAAGAGFHVVQVPDLVQPAPELRALGHPILPSLEAFAAYFEAALA
jgi:HAD superfamily hydrolase (TIGR01509 family)